MKERREERAERDAMRKQVGEGKEEEGLGGDERDAMGVAKAGE